MCFKKKKQKAAQTVRFAGKEGDLIWRHDILDVSRDCDVVADAFYQVVYMKNGRLMENMSGDRYTIRAEAHPFDARFYYVNCANAYPIKWGTRQQLRVIDGYYGIPVSVGASGSFRITVTDAQKLVAKLCSVRADLDTEYIQNYFSDQMTMHVMQILSRDLSSGKINTYALWANATEVAAGMQGALTAVFAEYGVEVSGFAISGIAIPPQDLQAFEELVKTIKQLEMQGVTLEQLRRESKEERVQSAETLLQFARIKAQSEGVRVNVVRVHVSDEERRCANCGAPLADGAKFCAQCGKSCAPETEE